MTSRRSSSSSRSSFAMNSSGTSLGATATTTPVYASRGASAAAAPSSSLYDDNVTNDEAAITEAGAAIHNERPSFFVIQVTAVASLGGILFGYDLGVISAALPALTKSFDLDSSQQELVVAILYLGGGIGAALGGSLCDMCGRKRTILGTDVVFLVGGLILYAAPTFEFVVAGRVVVGFAIAVSGIADVSYLHEIAPIQWRGAIVSVNEACISLGFLLAFAIGSILSAEGKESSWRILFGFSGLIALVQLVGMWRMPESPVWLKEQGRHEESQAALRRIRCDGSVLSASDSADASPRSGNGPAYGAVPSPNTSFDDVLASVTPSTEPSNVGIFGRCTFYCCQVVALIKGLGTFAVTTVHSYRRQAYIAVFLSVTQQLCGQTNVLSYAPIIFANAAGDAESSASYVQGWATLSIGLVKFAVTCLVIWKIETFGRRFLLLLGMATIAAGLLLLIIAFGDTQVEQQGETNVVDTGSGFHFAMPGVLLVVSGYSMSFGPLTWLLTSELFPTEIRGRALGASTIITYTCAAFVTYTFLSSQAWMGSSFVFGIYLAVTCLGFLFAYMAVPDTAGKTVQEIDNDLRSMLWWKGNCTELLYESQSGLESSPLRIARSVPLRETELT